MRTNLHFPFYIVRSVLALTLSFFLGAPPGHAQTAVTKIMPLGDSITRGSQRAGSIPGGYRRELANRLSAAGIPYDFVGSANDNPAPGIDPDHNGYDGIRTDQVLSNIQTWLNANPDVVLMKLGTNDMIQKVPVSTAANNLRSLIVRITDGAAARRLYVATIIPINEDRDGYTIAQWAPIINAYNTQVRNMVQEYSGQGRKVYLVDMNAGLTYTSSNSADNFFQPTDGTHPGQSGYNQMGAFWFNAIKSGMNTPPVSSGPSLISNGSFESDYASWSFTGNQGIQSAGAYGATDGSRLVAFNGGNSTPNGVLAQTFATVAGSTYTLTFDAGVLAYNTSQQRLLVTATGSGTLLSQVVTIAGSGNGTSWFRQNFTFTANSTSTTLTLRDQSTVTNSIDFLLDNVRVTGTSGGTPPANTPPVANADSYQTNLGTTLSVSAPGVLANDTDPQSNPLTALLDNAPGHGTLSLNANGGFSYTPAAGYAGADTFTYHANDGNANSGVVTVNLTVSNPGSAALVNGGFESGFSGWTVSGNCAAASGSPYSATEGSKLAAFNGGNLAPNAVISQTFATTAGQTHMLSFDAGALAYNTSSQTLLVTVTGGGQLLSKTITITGAGGGSNRWQPQSFSFVADGASATLSFRDQSGTTNAIDLLIDNVKVSVGSPARASAYQASAPAPTGLIPAADKPMAKQPPQATIGVIVIEGKKYRVLTVLKSTLPLGKSPVVEVSSNLKTWYSGKSYTTIITDNNRILKVRDNSQVRSGSKRYIRLKATDQITFLK